MAVGQGGEPPVRRRPPGSSSSPASAARPLRVWQLGHQRAFKTSLMEAALGAGAEGMGPRLFLRIHAIEVGIAQESDEPP